MYVREILARKGGEVKRVGADEALEVAAALMRLQQVGALVVSGPEDRLAGIVSEKDVVRAIVDSGPRALQMKVSEFMERRPLTCSPADTVAKAANAMTLRRARHVPVVEDGRIVGIISIGDIVKDRFEEMELERDTLRDIAASHRVAG
jgi:CBS domain-containing protein